LARFRNLDLWKEANRLGFAETTYEVRNAVERGKLKDKILLVSPLQLRRGTKGQIRQICVGIRKASFERRGF
jgi:hypothetical protein